MKYLVNPTSRFNQITHFDGEQCYRVLALADDSSVMGPGEIRETLEGLTPIPTPETIAARVPREISNWRCKAVLHSMGMLETVEQMMAGLPEPQKTVVSLAWNSDGKVSRTSTTVTAMAAALHLTPAQIDDMFRAAEALTI